MDRAKQTKLVEAGWRVGSAADFLGLSEEEAAFVEMKLALSESLRDQRRAHGLSQVGLAKKLRSSQSRVAKMEASDPSVSFDLLVRGLLAAGASPEEIASALAPKRRSAA